MNDMQITPPPMTEAPLHCIVNIDTGFMTRIGAYLNATTARGALRARGKSLERFDAAPVYTADQLTARDQQWLAIVKEAVEAEREACAAACAGIYAGHAAAARRLEDREATHAAGQRDGANECAAAIRSRSTT
jgi:hypothetical protein